MAVMSAPPRKSPVAQMPPMSLGMAAPAPMTNTLAQPVQRTPLQTPALPPSPGAPGFNYTPPTIGQAPTPIQTGTFQAPDPSQLANDPGVQFRLSQANKGAERSAAARGTLLSGGFQTALAKLNQGLASQEYGNLYDRALSTYGANRDTNQQNFGQSLGSYQAGTGAALDAGRLGLSGETARYDRAYGAGRDAYGDARDAASQQADVINTNAQARDAYEAQMAEYRAALADQVARQNAATTAGQGTLAARRPMFGQPGRFLRG
jgi:hypothetical protein